MRGLLTSNVARVLVPKFKEAQCFVWFTLGVGRDLCVRAKSTRPLYLDPNMIEVTISYLTDKFRNTHARAGCYGWKSWV